MPPLTGDPNTHPPSSFPTSLTGTCLCKSIRVTIHDGELFTRRRGHLCHCANCRKVAGSYVASNLVIEEDKVEVRDERGTLREYEDRETGSGGVVRRGFCGECGCPIRSVTALYPGKVIVKMGMFPRIPEPEFETFAAHRHPWQGKHEGVTQFKIKLGGEKLGE